MKPEEDRELLALSGLQHFAFCRRQWALIHIEKQWQENVRTVEGQLMHARAHNAKLRERRGDTLIMRDLAVVSRALGLSGMCDVVEFKEAPDGISLVGEEGLWRPFPVEYKSGRPKADAMDELQLCAQAMCLEEMLCCQIPEGALFYGETKRRVPVLFSEELRDTVAKFCVEMYAMYERGYTPKVKMTKACNACSLVELCVPKMGKRLQVTDYIKQHMQENEL